MKKIHSFLGSLKERTKNLELNRYKQAYMIAGYSITAVLLILTAEHYYSEDVNVTQVQAKIMLEPNQLDEQLPTLQEVQEAVLTSMKEQAVQKKEQARKLAEEEHTAARETGTTMQQIVQEATATAKAVQEKTATATEAAKAVQEKTTTAAAAAKTVEEATATTKVTKKEATTETVATTKAITLSKAERNVLERIVQAESGNQDIKGRMLVANVVLNRVNSESFPNTVKEVVFQHKGSKYQFSPAKSGSVNRVKVTSTTKEAVSRVLNGEDYSEGALYFVARKAANKKSLSWFDRELTLLFTHGGHTFYK